MSTTDVPELEASIDIAASPAAVWALVSDVRRMPEWSPQVSSVRLKGEGDPAPGARFTNLNKHGEVEWVTHAELVRFEPDREIAFRIDENTVIWSFRVVPTDGGTRLVQRRDAPDGITNLSREFVDSHLGGPEAFNAEVRAGMIETLTAIKAAAEA